MLRIDPARCLDPLTLSVLQDFDAVATNQGVSYFVCGAMARDILAWHVHGVPVPRATLDVDLAFSVSDWAAFHTLKSILRDKHGYLLDTDNPWKVWLPGPAGTPGYRVDLIPFGGIEAPAGEFAWPPDSEIIMNVLGFNDALGSACTVTVARDLEIPVVSLPMLAILKLLAWNDRRQHSVKDARDFAFLLTTYERMGVTARLYDMEPEILAAVDYHLDLAGARLLGKDAARAVTPVTKQVVVPLLGNATARASLITEIATSIRGRDDVVGVASSFLQQFELGLNEGNG